MPFYGQRGEPQQPYILSSKNHKEVLMFGSNVLEVAIGLVFVYLLLSLLCSTLNEFVITRFLALRAKTLKDGIRNLLNDPGGNELARLFYDDPLIKGLAKQGWFDKLLNRKSRPSYISSRNFALALKNVTQGFTVASDPDLAQALTTLIGPVKGDLEKEVASVEKWFDDAMERVSGWYVRKVQLILFILSLVIVVYLNVDTLALVRSLTSNSVMNAAIVAAAQGAAQKPLTSDLRGIQENFQLLQPALGWSTLPGDIASWIFKILGLLATTLAVSLGAPFWFDVLNKFISFRSTGTPPPTALKGVSVNPPLVSPEARLIPVEAERQGISTGKDDTK